MPSVNPDASCCCVCSSFVGFSGLCEGESAGRRRTLTTPPQMSATMHSAASPLTVIPAIAPTAKPLPEAFGAAVGIGIGEVAVEDVWLSVAYEVDVAAEGVENGRENVMFDVEVVEVKTVV